jgi:hypothetical protein
MIDREGLDEYNARLRTSLNEIVVESAAFGFVGVIAGMHQNRNK